MPLSWRWRHEQLAIDEVVARRHPIALVDEATNLLGRPAVSAKGWHGHNLLPVGFDAQLGTSQVGAVRRGAHHHCIPLLPPSSRGAAATEGSALLAGRKADPSLRSG